MINRLELAPTNRLGLVIPPPRHDCLGDNCETTARHGRCFISRHHLYFPANKFAVSSLARAFRNHQFNSINLHRCQHNELHREVDESSIPESDIMEAFLDEAKVLTDLGVALGALESLHLALTTDVAKKRARNPARYLRHVEQFTEWAHDLSAQVDQFEVMQPEIVNLHLGGLAVLEAV